MKYDYEIQDLRHKIRINNEKIDDLERAKTRLKNKRIELKEICEGEMKITSTLWRKRTTDEAKHLTTINYDFQQENLTHEANFITLITDTITYLNQQNNTFRTDINYYESKQGE